MLIRFLQDYRGFLTGEVFYTFGTEVDLPNGSDLVSAGRAEAVEVPKPEKESVAEKPKVVKQKVKKK